MSTFVLQNDSLVFGSQSPFNKYITEPGVKEKFFRYIGDRNSRVLVKRGFRTFLLMNKIFPNNVVEINENVKYSISQMVSPLMNLAVANDLNSILKLDKSKYSQGEILLTNELQKATKVKNLVAMVLDSETEHMTSHQGITTYITKKVSSCGNNEIIPTWDNKFFTFADANDIGIIVAIPKQYLANVLVCEYANFKEKGTIGNSIDNITYKEKIVNRLTVDLIKSFFVAIYSDCYRSRINGDIYNLETLFVNEGQMITSSGRDEENHDNGERYLFTKYANVLKKFKSSDNENLIYFMLTNIRYRNSILINPIEFYKGFIDIPYNQIESIFSKSNAFNRFNKDDNTLFETCFSNNLSEMDKFFKDTSKDILIYAMKLVRFLPFAIFNTYVIGNGADHNKMVQLISNIERIIPTLNNFRGSGAIYSNITSMLIEEIEFIKTKMFNDFSSPLNVTNKARLTITSAIDIYGAIKEEQVEEANDE